MKLDMSFELVAGDFETWKSCKFEIDKICEIHGIGFENRVYDEATQSCNVTVMFPSEESLYNATNDVTLLFESKGLIEQCVKAVDLGKQKAIEVIDAALAA